MIYDHQFGFRHNHNTNDALLTLTSNIQTALDKSMLAASVFVDLQKAFDTVDHSILLDKLNHYGIRGPSNDLINSYLKHRKQFVTIREKTSSQKDTPHGVPQGSVLGPLLFLMYINDLNYVITHSKVYHFADDTCLLYSDKNPKKIEKCINEDLKILNFWLHANKISLNTKKTEIIIFRSQHNNTHYDFNFRINKERINISNTTKYLGVHLDQHLTWVIHVSNLLPKLNRANGMLAKIRHSVSHQVLLSIYHALFQSHLNYAAQVWGQPLTDTKKKINTAQNKALRIICNKAPRSTENPLYLENKILKLPDLIHFQNFSLVLRHYKGLTPRGINNLLVKMTNSHHHETRNNLYANQKQTSYKVPKTNEIKHRGNPHTYKLPTTNKITYGTYSITTLIPKSWNEIIENLDMNPHDTSVGIAKSEAKNILLNKYKS